MVTYTPMGLKDAKGNEICADCHAGNHASHAPDEEKMRVWLLGEHDRNWRDAYDCKNELTNDKCEMCQGKGKLHWVVSDEWQTCEPCGGSGKTIPRTVAQCLCRANMPEQCVICGLPEFVHFQNMKSPLAPRVREHMFMSEREDREYEREMLVKHGSGAGMRRSE